MNAKPEPPSGRVEYEMGYGADEFGKVLLGPFSGARSDFNVVEIGRYRWLVSLVGSAFELEIDASEQPPRKIGLFALPVLRVRFNFDRAAADERDRFFHRFHQYFHKGGG
ncbi:MAG TPA: hypothetical protein VKB27_18565 [Gammaproteobacteria bacterium]|nr:hypothetical protein [Gammaproteobacteria bacterium]